MNSYIDFGVGSSVGMWTSRRVHRYVCMLNRMKNEQMMNRCLCRHAEEKLIRQVGHFVWLEGKQIDEEIDSISRPICMYPKR